MFVAPPDRTVGEDEWRPFVEGQAFGHFVAPGAGTGYPVVVPTQFVLDGREVLMHFAGPNPVFEALGADDRAVLSVAGDWAFVPSSWKAIDGEDPALGIPTTYYGAVQLRGRAEVRTAPEAVAGVLRRQLAALQPSIPVADPLEAHPGQLRAIRAVVLAVEEVTAKFKYGATSTPSTAGRSPSASANGMAPGMQPQPGTWSGVCRPASERTTPLNRVEHVFDIVGPWGTSTRRSRGRS